jgi:hypothetical protein
LLADQHLLKELFSHLEQGPPQIVERGWVMPPYSSFTPITPEERQIIISQSIVAGVYDQAVDRDSAYEMLQKKVLQQSQQKQADELEKQQSKEQDALAKQQAKEQERFAKEQQKAAEKAQRDREKLTQDIVGTFAKSAARSLGGSTGQKIVRGLLGSLFGK